MNQFPIVAVNPILVVVADVENVIAVIACVCNLTKRIITIASVFGV